MKWFRVVGLGLCTVAFSGGLQAAQQDPPPLDHPVLESQPATETPASPAADLQPTPEAAPRLAAAGLDSLIKPLMEGPLHEAFLSPAKNLDPVPVDKAPPAPITERPGVDPPNPNAQWVEGYWEWDANRKDFVWVTGTWRVPPPGKFWVNGYWRRDAKGWYRVPGFWSDRKTDRIDFRKNGPPADHPADEPGEAPGPDYFYVPGQYYPDGNGVVWKPGFWAKAQPGWSWVPAQWIKQPEGWTFQEGYWDRTLEDRGTLFTPAQVAPQARTADTVYQPYSRVAPETYGQLYGAFGRPNSYYDGYPGNYYDSTGRYYGYGLYGYLSPYYGYLDYPYYGTYGYPYVTSPVAYGYGGYGYGGLGCGLLGGLLTSAFGFGYGYPYYGLGYGGFGYPSYGYGYGYGYPYYGLGYGYGGLGYGLGYGYGGLGYGLGYGYGGLGFGFGGFGFPFFGFGGFGFPFFGFGGFGFPFFGGFGGFHHHRFPFFPGGNRFVVNGNNNRIVFAPGSRFINNVNTFNRNTTGIANNAMLARRHGVMPPPASRPFANPFVHNAALTRTVSGSHTGALHHGLVASGANWRPAFNGVQHTPVFHSTARPAFTNAAGAGVNRGVGQPGTGIGALGHPGHVMGAAPLGHLGAGHPGNVGVGNPGNLGGPAVHHGAMPGLSAGGLNAGGPAVHHGVGPGGFSHLGGPAAPNLGGFAPPARMGGFAPPAHMGGFAPPAHMGGFAPPAHMGGFAPPAHMGGFGGGGFHGGGFHGGGFHGGGGHGGGGHGGGRR